MTSREGNTKKQGSQGVNPEQLTERLNDLQAGSKTRTSAGSSTVGAYRRETPMNSDRPHAGAHGTQAPNYNTFPTSNDNGSVVPASDSGSVAICGFHACVECLIDSSCAPPLTGNPSLGPHGPQD